MLFLSSKTGYISIELLILIMEAFNYCWATTQPSVDCILISDNLAIQRNSAIVAMAKSSGIHMISIMLGSSHLFQVHDQLLLAELKKLRCQIFTTFFPLPPQNHRLFWNYARIVSFSMRRMPWTLNCCGIR